MRQARNTSAVLPRFRNIPATAPFSGAVLLTSVAVMSIKNSAAVKYRQALYIVLFIFFIRFIFVCSFGNMCICTEMIDCPHGSNQIMSVNIYIISRVPIFFNSTQRIFIKASLFDNNFGVFFLVCILCHMNQTSVRCR